MQSTISTCAVYAATTLAAPGPTDLARAVPSGWTRLPPGDPHGGGGTCSASTSLLQSSSRLPIGQMRTKALPMIWPSPMGPKDRLSDEFVRLSPITQ